MRLLNHLVDLINQWSTSQSSPARTQEAGRTRGRSWDLGGFGAVPRQWCGYGDFCDRERSARRGPSLSGPPGSGLRADDLAPCSVGCPYGAARPRRETFGDTGIRSAEGA
ncbi:hypothetical protein GCM10028832_12420 [Streptomyces sparsus]